MIGSFPGLMRVHDEGRGSVDLMQTQCERAVAKSLDAQIGLTLYFDVAFEISYGRCTAVAGSGCAIMRRITGIDKAGRLAGT